MTIAKGRKITVAERSAGKFLVSYAGITQIRFNGIHIVISASTLDNV
jgi:hypothetical protein